MNDRAFVTVEIDASITVEKICIAARSIGCDVLSVEGGIRIVRRAQKPRRGRYKVSFADANDDKAATAVFAKEGGTAEETQ